MPVSSAEPKNRSTVGDVGGFRAQWSPARAGDLRAGPGRIRWPDALLPDPGTRTAPGTFATGSASRSGTRRARLDFHDADGAGAGVPAVSSAVPACRCHPVHAHGWNIGYLKPGRKKNARHSDIPGW